MNKKHINAQLCRIFDDFISTIDDEKVKELVKNGTIITGGALVSLLQGEVPHDYDMYFKDFKTCYEVAKYFVDKFNDSKKSKKAEIKIKIGNEWTSFEIALQNLDKEPRIKIFISSVGIAGEYEDDESIDDMQTNIEPDTDIEKELKEEPKYQPKFLTSNAISLSGKIQLVIRFYGEADKLHENYDFVHCTNYWTSWDRKVTLKQEALESIINKELLYVGSKYPLCSIIRTRKFINRGWTINAGQYLKMCMQLNELNLKDISVLEDQLVGVDSTFFAMLIDALQKKKEDDPNFEVNNSYVATIIDKIF
ncbi:hypothetical protein GCM10008908_24310 [Clostridium subterminale]|uniref:Nucleotidyl transferase AbiEii/AbiGii toxin family protein n=1 Tax=Clostridium subterminale TaxID=1550 RepID=A0ABN1KRT3_CLOSU